MIFLLGFLVGLVVGVLFHYALTNIHAFSLIKREFPTANHPLNWRILVGPNFYFDWLDRKKRRRAGRS